MNCVIFFFLPFLLVVGYGGGLNALVERGAAILCRAVSPPPLPRLRTATDHTG